MLEDVPTDKREEFINTFLKLDNDEFISSISPDAWPGYILDGLKEVLLIEDEAELGRLLMRYARPYLMDATQRKMEL